MNEQNNNNGALFHNLRKTSENSPAFRGHAIINGVQVRITAWNKVSASGTQYLSLAFENEADFQARMQGVTATAPAPTPTPMRAPMPQQVQPACAPIPRQAYAPIPQQVQPAYTPTPQQAPMVAPAAVHIPVDEALETLPF